MNNIFMLFIHILIIWHIIYNIFWHFLFFLIFLSHLLSKKWTSFIHFKNKISFIAVKEVLFLKWMKSSMKFLNIMKSCKRLCYIERNKWKSDEVISGKCGGTSRCNINGLLVLSCRRIILFCFIAKYGHFLINCSFNCLNCQLWS